MSCLSSPEKSVAWADGQARHCDGARLLAFQLFETRHHHIITLLQCLHRASNKGEEPQAFAASLLQAKDAKQSSKMSTASKPSEDTCESSHTVRVESARTTWSWFSSASLLMSSGARMLTSLWKLRLKSKKDTKNGVEIILEETFGGSYGRERCSGNHAYPLGPCLTLLD